LDASLLRPVEAEPGSGRTSARTAHAKADPASNITVRALL